MPESTSAADEMTDTARTELDSDRFDYYVTLDLGSESMAACFQHREDRAPIPIHLQRLASRLLPARSGQLGAELLHEENEEAPSDRLRTRISLEGGRQPQPLPAVHATQILQDEDHSTLFGFFHPEGRALGAKLLPNPKLLFQTGVRKIIPEVEAAGGGTATFQAAELLEHLIGQVLINFVLGAPEIKEDAKSRGIAFQLERVHLSITVPNVYSLGHARKLEAFLRERVPVGAVRVVYESDAIAYYMMGNVLPTDPPEIGELKDNLWAVLRQDDQGDPQQEGFLLLTIDIGKGTTDLSLFNFYMARRGQGRVLSCDISARTGRSHGGARLSYLLAAHFETRIRGVLASYEMDERLASAIAEARTKVGLLAQPGWVSGRASLLGAAEKLVEAVKRHIDGDYRITLTLEQQAPLVQTLAHAVRAEVARALAPARTSKAEAPALTSVAEATSLSPEELLDNLERDLERALYLPAQLPTDTFSSSLQRRFSRFRRRSSEQVAENAPFLQLRRDLELYVRANVDEPLDWLNEMAAAREFGGQTPLTRRRSKFVVVAGQASQFQPIQQAIQKWVTERMGLPSGDLVFLRGKLAKFACSFGAQWFFRNAIQVSNPDAILGSYAFLRAGGLVTLPMKEFESRQILEVPLDAGEYWLIFQPRHIEQAVQASVEEIKKIRDSGAVAYIRTLGMSEPWTIQLQYGGPEVGIQFRLKGREDWSDLAPEATFGDIDENIYSKTWPEAVNDAK
jgi:hypothetical protein